MIIFLKILSLCRQSFFAVLDQLQNHRRLILCSFCDHRASRLDFKLRDGLTRSLMQARKYLTDDRYVRMSAGVVLGGSHASGRAALGGKAGIFTRPANVRQLSALSGSSFLGSALPVLPFCDLRSSRPRH